MPKTQIQISAKTEKEIILSMITAEMRNQKLIMGLDKAGALVEDLHTDLATTILKLIGFDDAERDDDLYDFYELTLQDLIDIELDVFLKKLPVLALEMYTALLKERINGV